MLKQDWLREFVPGVIQTSQNDSLSFYFLFNDKNELILKQFDNLIIIPTSADFDLLKVQPQNKLFIGEAAGIPCFTGKIEQTIPLPEGLISRGLRQLYGLFSEDLFSLAGLAFQIIHWDKTHQFCGQCGTPTYNKMDERAKICPNCKFLSFPRLSPAIIVAIIKDEQILLARGKNFSKDYYSVIAGFVEPGESLEECIKREVQEEVGLKVKNIRYFGSQPWPFPNSLMLGFIADYASGSIIVDQKEILEANWFKASFLPNTPDQLSIAGKLINNFVQKNKKSDSSDPSENPVPEI